MRHLQIEPNLNCYRQAFPSWKAARCFHCSIKGYRHNLGKTDKNTARIPPQFGGYGRYHTIRCIGQAHMFKSAFYNFHSTTEGTYSFWCSQTYRILFVSFFAMRTIARCFVIRFLNSLYAAVIAGSLRTAIQAASIMRYLRNLLCRGVMPFTRTVAPLDAVEGTNPMKLHKWSSLWKRWISTNSARTQ
jgi:hypothetical protein